MTYLEMFNLTGDTDLLNRVASACVISAEAIRVEAGATANHANRMLWAKRAYENPVTEAKRLLPAVLAQNINATVLQVQSASDANILTAVNNAINVFAIGS